MEDQYTRCTEKCQIKLSDNCGLSGTKAILVELINNICAHNGLWWVQCVKDGLEPAFNVVIFALLLNLKYLPFEGPENAYEITQLAYLTPKILFGTAARTFHPSSIATFHKLTYVYSSGVIE